MTVIVDYGVGNVASLYNMFQHIGGDAVISRDPDVILNARSLVFPGVGAFDHAMLRIRSSGILPALEKAVLERRTPVLGVCLGMQMLADASEEGSEPGLGWIKGRSRRLKPDATLDLKVPNNGWRNIRVLRNSPVLGDVGTEQRFYFNHSYFLSCDTPSDTAAVFDFGEDICCAVARGNIWGVQFHPEKSHSFGMDVLGRFLTLESVLQ
jgi:imidazole glycerol-phosphate synthase subunit HisH